jgi:uncharacterized protein (DUF1697 family)
MRDVEREVDGYESYTTFVSDAAVHDELAALADGAGSKASSNEKISRGDGVVYWQVPKGSTLDSTIGKTMGQAALQVLDYDSQPAHAGQSLAVSPPQAHR